MRLKRFDESEVAMLHDAERHAEGNWMIAGAQALTRIDKLKGPYWPKTMAEDERNRAVEQFMVDPVIRRAFASLDNSEGSEMELLHKADWEVHKKGPNPTESQAQSAMASLYKKSI